MVPIFNTDKVFKDKHIARKGFTLIELITVITVLGILVMIAVPNFMNTKRMVSGAEILNNIKMVEYNVSMKEVMTETDVVDYFALGEIDTSDIQDAYDDKRLFNKHGYAQINYLEGFYDLSNTEVTENISGTTDGTFAINNGSVFFIADKTVNVAMDYTEEPLIIILNKNGSDEYWTEYNVAITISGNDELVHQQYTWTNSQSTPSSSSYAPLTDGSNIDDQTIKYEVSSSAGGLKTGIYYLHIRAEDAAGNVATYVSDGFKLMNYFTFDEDTGTIIGYKNGSPKNVVIPDKINGVNVTTIGESAFVNSGLTSVEIPNSVTIIGNDAFVGAFLTDVTIPDSVTSIGDYAFSNSTLTNVTIGNGVTIIGTGVFGYNYSLTNVIIPNSVTTIGDYAFTGAPMTDVTIPDSVTSIGYGAFMNSGLTNVTIGNGVTIIGANAFYYNKLTSVTIPDGVTTIGNWAFWRNELTSVTIPDGVTTIGDQAFFRNKLISVTIPNSVTTIGNSAFANNGPDNNSGSLPSAGPWTGTWSLSGKTWGIQ